MGKNNTPLIIGGGIAALGALYFLSRSSAATPAAGTNFSSTIPGAPAPPLVYNDSYYKTYQYPALVAANPNLLNPNYQLTAQDATNYYNNYLELQQWWNGEANKQFPSLQAALQWHWKNAGVPLQYSFVPFTPPKNVNWTPPPPKPKSTGSGVFSTILKAVTIAAGGVVTVATGGAAAPLVAAGESAVLTAESAIHGIDDGLLNDADIELITTMAPITEKIIEFYRKSDPTLVNSISIGLTNLVSTYAL